MSLTLKAMALATAARAGPATAGDVDTVRAFYSDILSNAVFRTRPIQHDPDLFFR